VSTGSVNPITPNGPTQLINAGTANATVTFNQCDALYLYNGGTADVFVATGNAGQTVVASTTASFPVPHGQVILLGTPGVVGVDSAPITQLGAITATGTSNLYVTPVLGTQR
jgi:hypothetical protein